ncbi:MAG: PTS sugar transporter subunit IIA [Tepidanaerobacteraceae bacterium]|nr:PTS sugar transporter subunit IIA [Tepidanaerobacteraceae bacterium]
MRKIIIATHGDLGRALLSSAELICGKQENVVVLSIKHQVNMDDFKLLIEKELENFADEKAPLILVDVFGGSPSNAAVMQIKDHDITVMTGVNLPMLLEILSGREACGLDELVKLGFEAGTQGIKIIDKSFFKK